VVPSSPPDSGTDPTRSEGERRPPRRRGRLGDLVGRLALVLLLVAFVAGGAWAVGKVQRAPREPAAPPFLVPLQNVEPGVAAPVGAGEVPTSGEPQAAPAGQPTTADEPLNAWALRVAGNTDIPVRALRAYAIADLVMRAQEPACRISWATLAGIGRIESHHGEYGEAVLGEDGRTSPPIIGIPLDGSPGVKAIGDTDGGRLDGDTTWDRAVGPMQFIPGTWVRYAMRANGDGSPADPQNIDDAALTAARYLCSSGTDLATGEGWWRAVMRYNESVEYGRNVYSGADAYARASVES
jgi:hypothetical protein